MARFDLTGKIALVAGASRGIGEAVAHGLAEHGATVICASRKLEPCEAVAADIRAKGGKADAMVLHLGEIDTHDAALAERSA
jgi:NAD(P)-dependent dehydrogenase (short-subunit alcohol dehydrogenase family)